MKGSSSTITITSSWARSLSEVSDMWFKPGIDSSMNYNYRLRMNSKSPDSQPAVAAILYNVSRLHWAAPVFLLLPLC
jgi:hypothetical protein